MNGENYLPDLTDHNSSTFKNLATRVEQTVGKQNNSSVHRFKTLSDNNKLNVYSCIMLFFCLIVEFFSLQFNVIFKEKFGLKFLHSFVTAFR